MVRRKQQLTKEWKSYKKLFIGLAVLFALFIFFIFSAVLNSEPLEESDYTVDKTYVEDLNESSGETEVNEVAETVDISELIKDEDGPFGFSWDFIIVLVVGWILFFNPFRRRRFSI